MSETGMLIPKSIFPPANKDIFDAESGSVMSETNMAIIIMWI